MDHSSVHFCIATYFRGSTFYSFNTKRVEPAVPRGKRLQTFMVLAQNSILIHQQLPSQNYFKMALPEVR